MLIGVIAEELLLSEAGSGWPAAPFVDADSFPLATIAVSGFLLPDLFDEGDIVYAAFVTGGLGVFPQLFIDSDSFFNFTKSDVVAIAPPHVSDADLFYSPAVLANVLAPLLFIDEDLFGGIKKLQKGKASINQVITIDKVFDSDIILPPVVERAGETNYLISASFPADDRFLTPDVRRILAPALVTAPDVIYAASRFDRLLPSRVFDSDAVYPGSFGGLGLLPGLPIAADAFFAPTVVGGAITISPSLVGSDDAFFAPAVGTGAAPVTLTAGLVTDSDTIYAPTGTSVCLPAVVTDTDNFYSPSVSGTQVLVAGIFTDADTFFAPTVKQAGFDGTIAIDGPIMPSTPQPTVILVEG